MDSVPTIPAIPHLTDACAQDSQQAAIFLAMGTYTIWISSQIIIY